MNRGNTNINEGMIVAVAIIFHSRLHMTAEHQDRPASTVTIKTSPQNIARTLLQISLKLYDHRGGYWSSREQFWKKSCHCQEIRAQVHTYIHTNFIQDVNKLIYRKN